MFWSRYIDLAAKVAKEKGEIISEQTPGASIINGGEYLNKAFSWGGEGVRPHGPDFWGRVSAEYSRGATGTIDVIQDFEKNRHVGAIYGGNTNGRLLWMRVRSHL